MKRKLINLSLILLGIGLLIIPKTQSIYSNNKKDKEVTIGQSKERLRAGTYFVEIKADNELDQTMSEYVRMHVRYPKTVLNYDHQEGIDAHDVVVLTGSFNPNNKEKVKKDADARAWDMNTGLEIKDINVNIKEPIKHSGTVANVEFSTKNNTTVEANVFEQDVINIKLDELYMNQYSVIKDRIMVMTSTMLVLAVFPGTVLLILFTLIKRKSDKIHKLLDE